MNASLESREGLGGIYALENLENLEVLDVALGGAVRLVLGPGRHRLCDYPDDLLVLVEADSQACVFRAVGPGQGEIRLECAEAGAWSSGVGSRSVPVTVRAGQTSPPEPLRAPDLCL